MGDPQTIELNGNIYDAVTGKLLKAKPLETQPANPAAPSHQKPIRTIDGVISSFKHVGIKPGLNQPTHEPEPALKSHSLAPASARAVEHSKTLMRNAVKKPPMFNHIKKDKANLDTHTQKLANTISSNLARPLPVAKELINRAQQIQKSQLVSKFDQISSTITKPINDLIPEKQPEQELAKPSDVDPAYTKKLDTIGTIDKKIQQGSTNDLDAMMIASIEKADSLQPIERKKTALYARLASKLHLKPKTFILSSVIVLVLAVIGVGTYLYFNNLVLYVDSSRAGLRTKLPSYTEPGFSLSEITRVNSAIYLNYSSNTDSRNYKVTEQLSTWDSQSLVDSVVEPSVGQNYTMTEVNGRIVYFYNKTAVWVDGTIYYMLLNNAGLTQNQLNQIIDGI